MKLVYTIVATLFVLTSLTAKAQLSTTTYTFTHPCAMYTQADFDRVKASLDNNTAAAVVQKAYEALKNSSFTQSSYTAHPVETLVRGDVTGTGVEKENYINADRDAAAAYQMALLWKLSGDDSYAQKAVGILNSWASTCKTLTANDNNKYLCAGAQGYTFAVAAEMLLSYSGWTETEKTAFKTWIVSIFGTMNKTFLDTHGNPKCRSSKHYWSNWDLVNEASYMAIGILTENSDMVDYVVNYFHNGVGNGAIKNLCLQEQTVNGELMMQNQESGRDQGHAEMSAMVAANLAQMAYALLQVQNGSSGSSSVSDLNFWAANDNALLKMEEYVALSNLRDGSDNGNEEGSFVMETMPFKSVGPWCSGSGDEANKTHTALGESSRGLVRPGFELVLNYYKNANLGANMGYKYIEQMASKMRPECGAGDSRYGSNSGAFDQLGWGTLMTYTEEGAVYNATTKTSYESLAEAVSAATDGDMIRVNSDQTVSARLDIGTNITIKGGSGKEKIYRDTKKDICTLLAKADVTIENLTFDGQGVNRGKTAIESSTSGKTLTLKDVTIQNYYNTTAASGIIQLKNNGKVVLEGVKIQDCTVQEGHGNVFAGSSTLTLKGDNAIGSIYNEKSYSINAAETKQTTPISIIIGAVTEGSTIIKGNTDTNIFSLTNEGYEWKVSGSNLTVVPQTSAVESVEGDYGKVANGTPYNLLGQRVSKTAKGLIIIGGKKILTE